MNDRPATRRGLAVLLVVALIVAACGGDDGEETILGTAATTPPPSGDEPASDDDSPADEPSGSDETVPAETGDDPVRDDEEPVADDPVTVVSDDGTARLTFAPGTLPDGVAPGDVTVVAIDAAEADITTEVDGESIPPVASYRLAPSGIVFSSPALLEVDVGFEALPVAPIFVLRSDDGAIDLADPIGLGEIGDDTVTIEVEVAHFSVITALHGPSPLGTVFLSPPDAMEFGVSTHFPVVLQASFDRDFLSHAIVTPNGIIRLRVPRERLELIVGRELFVGGAITFDGRSLTSQLEIDIDAERPMSEAQEDLPFTCADEGAGTVFVETGLTDLELELVDDDGEVIGLEPRNLLAVDLLEVECVLEVEADPPPPGTYEVSGQFVSDCGTYPLFFIVSVFADGTATVAQRASQNGPIFQTATGIAGPFGVMAVLLTTTIFEIWLVLFDLANIVAVYNTNGLLNAYSDAFDAPTSEHVAVISDAVGQGDEQVIAALEEVSGAGGGACTAPVTDLEVTDFQPA